MKLVLKSAVLVCLARNPVSNRMFLSAFGHELIQVRWAEETVICIGGKLLAQCLSGTFLLPMKDAAMVALASQCLSRALLLPMKDGAIVFDPLLKILLAMAM